MCLALAFEWCLFVGKFTPSQVYPIKIRWKWVTRNGVFYWRMQRAVWTGKQTHNRYILSATSWTPFHVPKPSRVVLLVHKLIFVCVYISSASFAISLVHFSPSPCNPHNHHPPPLHSLISDPDKQGFYDQLLNFPVIRT